QPFFFHHPATPEIYPLPYTTLFRSRETSRVARSCSSQVSRHGQLLHALIRDGCASGSPPVAAAVATANRSANRASYSSSALRPPGQLGICRLCHSTASPSTPMTPPVRSPALS